MTEEIKESLKNLLYFLSGIKTSWENKNPAFSSEIEGIRKKTNEIYNMFGVQK